MMRIATIGFASVLALSTTAGFAGNHGQGGGQMQEFVQEWDMNGDGVVTIDDLSTRRQDLFDMFDLNGEGGIDAEEQANMAQTIAGQMEANHGGEGQGGGHGRGGPGQMIHAAMTADYADSDRNGVISNEEWTAATPRLFAELDSNGDGELNQMDFRRGH